MIKEALIRKVFTNNQLSALQRVCDIHLTFVQRLKIIYEQQPSETRRPLLVDYQELASYAQPLFRPNLDTGEWLDYVSFSFLLDNAPKNSLVLPEGAFLELLGRLEHLSDESELGPAILDNIIRLERATGYSFHGLFEHTKLSEFESSLQFGLPTKDLALLSLNALAQRSSVAKRLEHCLNRDAFTNPPDEFLDTYFSQAEVSRTFSFIYNQLKQLRRSTRSRQANFADALNFAWAFALNQKYEVPQIFLLTHTRALRLASDALLSQSPGKSSFLWTPATAVYDAILENESKGNKFEWLLQIEAVCLDMQRSVEETLGSGSALASSYSQDLEFVRDLSNQEIKDFLAPFDKYAVGPLVRLFGKFEAIYRENFVDVEDKLPGTSFARTLAKKDLVLGGDAGLALERAKCRVRTVIKAAEIKDGTSLKMLDFYKVKSIAIAPDVTSVRLAKRSLMKSFNLFVDNYQNFSAVYWKTTLSLWKVVEIINELLLQLEKSSIMVVDKRVRADVYKQGLVAYILSQTHDAIHTSRVSSPLVSLPIHLEHSFSLGEQQKIDFVRINTQVADFCYYGGRHISAGEELYPEMARLVGLFIKEPSPSLAASFFSQTSTESVSVDWIREFIQQSYFAKGTSVKL